MSHEAMKSGEYLTMRLKTDESSSESGPLKIYGVANDAGVTDSFGTRIKLSQRALDNFMDNPICLFNHDVHNPIGKFTRIAYEGNRLVVEGEIDENACTPTGANVSDLARKRILQAFSIRFDDFKETRQKDYVQYDADTLDEISVVTLPSNRASLFQLRSKGVTLHGAPEILDRTMPALRVADLRTPDTNRAAGPLSLDLLERRLRECISELNETSDWDEWFGLVAVYDGHLIYQEWYESRFYQVGYSVDASGNVALTGQPVEVLPSWTVVGAATDPEDAGLEETTTRQTPEAAQQSRLHPDDITLIVNQLRGAVSPKPSSTEDEVPLGEAITSIRGLAPTEEAVPLNEALTEIRSLAPTTPAEPETITIDDVRASIRTALQPQPSGAPVS